MLVSMQVDSAAILSVQDTLTVSGAAVFKTTLNVQGATKLDSTLTVSAAVVFKSSLSLASALPIASGGTSASSAATARTNLGINVNSARSYTAVVLALNTDRTPSTTQDTLVIATVDMALDDGETSTMTFQVNDGGGHDSICSVTAQFDPTGVGVAGTFTSAQTMTVIVPANSIYKIISAGTGVNTITTINELTL